MSAVDDLRRQLAEQRDTIAALRSYIAEMKAEVRGVDVPWPPAWGLTAMEQRVAWAIFRAGAKICTKDILYRAMYGEGERDRNPKILDVMICRVRAKLRPMQIDIVTVHGLGWQFTPAAHAALASLLGREAQ